MTILIEKNIKNYMTNKDINSKGKRKVKTTKLVSNLNILHTAMIIRNV